MYIISAIVLIIMLSSCTYTISMAHTEGTASDVIDDTATTSPNTSVPVSVVPRVM